MSGYIINLSNVSVTANRQTAIDGIKNAILGIRDIQVLNGLVPGWVMSITGTNEPSRIMWKSTQTGTEWLAATSISYNADGTVSSLKYQYSNDSVDGSSGSGNWYNLGDSSGKYILSFTYDGSGNLTSTTWT